MTQIYRFGWKADGGKEMSDHLGGKGAGLAEMTKIGFDVPSGITIPTTACQEYRTLGGTAGDRLAFVAKLVDDTILPALARDRG